MTTSSDASGIFASLKVVIGIATTGRAGIVRETLQQIASLTDRPDAVLLCIADASDFDTNEPDTFPFPFDVITTKKGLCNQRNALLDAVDDDTVLLFLDDDFLISDGFISATRRVFAQDANVVMATGHVLADGILGPGLTHEDGLRLLSTASAPTDGIAETYNGYGCNMAVRSSNVRAHGLRFDPELSRYGWLEDVDFSRRLAHHGRIVKVNAMQGVHLGTKTGRSRGVPLGYSQIANPIYMIRKGSLSHRRGWYLMLRNFAANAVKIARSEPWVDRPGRLKGNLLAIKDLLTGKIAPTRILDL